MNSLRGGFTTGTCAAAAAKAATMLLLGGPTPSEVEVILPDGTQERFIIIQAERNQIQPQPPCARMPVTIRM